MTAMYYDPRPCGAGKTYQEISYILENPGRYLYAVEKRSRMKEFEADIRKRASETGVMIKTSRICSAHDAGEIMADGTVSRHGSTNVRKDVEDLPHLFPNPREHRIVLITHEALKMVDASEFSGWHLTIDETPSVWDKQSLSVNVDNSRDFLRDNYVIEPLTKTQSRIVMRSDEGFEPLSVRDLARDSFSKTATVLHQRIGSERIEVTTELSSWNELDADNTAFEWSSIWSPEGLKAFSRVHVLANAFDRSVTFQLFTKKWPEIKWKKLDRPTQTRHARRKVTIHCYAWGHEAKRNLWNSAKGKANLRLIAMDVRNRIGDSGHIWMCNGDDERVLTYPDAEEGYIIPGYKLSPRQQGSNRYSAIHNATMLYTSKPTTSERAALREIGIDAQYVIDSREREVMVQFACRTSVRDAKSTEPVNLFVYDFAQANHLKEYFASTGFCDVEIECVDLGFGGYRPETACKKRELTEAELEAKREKQREQARERKRRQRKREADLRAA